MIDPEMDAAGLGDETAPAVLLTDDIRDLIALVEKSAITEIAIENGPWKVRITRQLSGSVVQVAPAPAVSDGYAPPAANGTHMVAKDDGKLHTVVSPMVGTFFRSPDPKARAFVAEGEQVERGQVIGIIEAMKIMNEITSDFAGRCARVLVENGQPVEYGQPLLTIEP